MMMMMMMKTTQISKDIFKKTCLIYSLYYESRMKGRREGQMVRWMDERLDSLNKAQSVFSYIK